MGLFSWREMWPAREKRVGGRERRFLGRGRVDSCMLMTWTDAETIRGNIIGTFNFIGRLLFACTSEFTPVKI